MARHLATHGRRQYRRFALSFPIQRQFVSPRNASSISARGVFCVFLTNARTTTILRPIAVTRRRILAVCRQRRPRPCMISNPRSPAPAGLPLHVLAQRPIDACLIALAGFRVALEPGDDIGVEPKCQLLFDRSIEDPTLGARPVEEFRGVRRINSAIGQRNQRLQFRPLLTR
jgi:hypothetical protein